MTDKELLEQAAKAAGHTDTAQTIIEAGWNPLGDDGDALRLAVKLRLDVEQKDKSVWVSGDDEVVYEMRYVSGDEYAATRRAIVRAAAEIGKLL